jgi:hypothetical protein
MCGFWFEPLQIELLGEYEVHLWAFYMFVGF